MHVRLEALDAAVLTQHEVAFGGLDGVRRQVDAAGVGGAHQVQHLAVLRLLALRVEVDAELDRVGDVFAAVRVVDVPHDLRAGQHQLAAVRTHHLALLADGPFHERAGQRVAVGVERIRRQVVGFDLLQARDRVVRDLAALHRAGTDLDGAHPARLGEPGRHDRLPPRVVGAGLLRPAVERDDQVRLVWPNSLAKFQPCSLGHSTGLGMSFASPFGAPASTQRTTVSISASVSERSFAKSWMPSVLSMCHGGICRVCTRVLIERAHGRDCS